MQLDEVKVVIAKKQLVEHQGINYTVSAVIMRLHHKEIKWYYQLELQDLKTNCIVIADIERVDIVESEIQDPV